MRGPTGEETAAVVARLVRAANVDLPADVERALAAARARETDETGRFVLDVLLRNAALARETGLPLCQDTGIDVVFLRVGTDLAPGWDPRAVVDEGVRRATREGHLRASVCDPLTRANTGDNTPAVVHVEAVAGARLEVAVLPKGCGSENMSALFMLPPSAGVEGVVAAAVRRVVEAGPNPCPPGVIGVGIGGTMERAAFLAKKALLRPLGAAHPRADVAALEAAILEGVNAAGAGPLGLGGAVSALGVAAEVFPCHIASLPVAVNVQCHAARRRSASWEAGRWTLSEAPAPSAGAPAPVFSGAKRVRLPLDAGTARGLRAGDRLLLTGPLYTGRDQTHRRLVELLDRGEPLPVDLRGQLLYYVGPSPAPPGAVVGSAGPTTSYRMDAYTPRLLEAAGIRATMGKGRRSPEVREAHRRHGAVYLATLGGAGAELARRIRACEVAAFPELGPEALFRMEVEDFPAVVIDDTAGGDYYDAVAGRPR
ncbi:fumarate hydratase [Dissulfurirhabdus thermomarina]